MPVLIPILTIVFLVCAITWAHEAPYRRELARKRKLRASVLNWKENPTRRL